MKSKKRVVILAISILVILVLTVVGYNMINNQENSEETINQTKNITINIYGKDEAGIIFTKNIEAQEEYLVDVINNNSDINIVLETGPYGAYITSIMNIEQGDGYYWMYYVNNNYASEGISNCKVEENAIYDFKIEKYQ